MQTVRDQIEEKVERLKKVYERSEMPQEIIAREIGVNRQTVYNWIQGRTMPKSQLQTDAIDRFLGKYSNYLK